jgi:hypothetical protein
VADNNVAPRTNLPVISIIAAVSLVGLAIVALIFVHLDDRTTPVFLSVIGLIVTTVPSLIAAAYAERVSKDVRNGVVEDKVRTATKDALAEHGVVTRDGPFVAASTEALLRLLQETHDRAQDGSPRPKSTDTTEGGKTP